MDKPKASVKANALQAARGFISYFRRLAKNRGYPESARGVELAERWVAMIESAAPSETEIHEVLRELEAGEKDSGSGWHDMSIQFSAWAWRIRHS